MKTGVLLTMTAGVLSLMACSRDIPESQIPSVVVNALNLEFTGVTDVEWEKNGNLYEVEFEIDNINHEAIIEETGKLVKYIKELKYEELPEKLKSSITTTQDISKIDEVHFLVVGENTYYQLEFEGPLTDSQKIYNESGEEIENMIYFE